MKEERKKSSKLKRVRWVSNLWFGGGMREWGRTHGKIKFDVFTKMPFRKLLRKYFGPSWFDSMTLGWKMLKFIAQLGFDLMTSGCIERVEFWILFYYLPIFPVSSNCRLSSFGLHFCWFLLHLLRNGV